VQRDHQRRGSNPQRPLITVAVPDRNYERVEVIDFVACIVGLIEALEVSL
jgi:hypothetical protein